MSFVPQCVQHSDKFDNNYFSRVYDIPGDEIDIMSSQTSVEEGDNVHYFAMRAFMHLNGIVEWFIETLRR